MKKIIVVKHSKGSSVIEAIGFKGQGCHAATAAIEAALGQVMGIKEKEDLWQQETTVNEHSLETRLE